MGEKEISANEIKHLIESHGYSKGKKSYLIRFGIPRRWRNGYKKYATQTKSGDFQEIFDTVCKIKKLGGTIFGID